MAVIIAGREAKVGDALYHVGYQAWGTVTALDLNSVILRIGNEGSFRDVYVSSGGIAGGKRQIYWHAPLALDRPFADIGRYQRVLDALVGEGL